MTFYAGVDHAVSAYAKRTLEDFICTSSAVLVLFAFNSEPKSFILTCSLYHPLFFKSLLPDKSKNFTMV